MNKGRGLELPDGLIDLHGGALMCWTASVWWRWPWTILSPVR